MIHARCISLSITDRLILLIFSLSSHSSDYQSLSSGDVHDGSDVSSLEEEDEEDEKKPLSVKKSVQYSTITSTYFNE